jgi:cytochrome c oxidase subunit II
MPFCAPSSPAGCVAVSLWRARVFVLVCLAGCEGRQSALAPAGRGADRLVDLFLWMSVGALLIWIVVLALTAYGAFVDKAHSARAAERLVIAGGVVVPTAVLAVLLTYGLSMLPSFVEAAPEGSLKVHVVGHQWWWRVRYFPKDGAPFDLANEIQLPVGAPVEIELESRDVIHSFWIPSLGGKMDMIPGRKTRLVLEPTKAGVFRGVCAEYCGDSHAFMAFSVIVLEPEAFDRWIAEQSRPALEPSDELARRGHELFLENGCGACHAVRGTRADGVIGPDLTHVGGRSSLGAGLLGTRREDFRRFIAETHRLKPGVQMPAFGMLPEADLEAIARYLEGLE